MTCKIAFIGRQPHSKTGSDRFLIEVLERFAEVRVYRKESQPARDLAREVNAFEPDYLVFYQLPPSLTQNLLRLRCKKIVWVPMWDGFALPGLRKRLGYRFFNVRMLNFSSKTHEAARSLGLTSLSMQYFPAPPPMVAPVRRTPPYTVLLWQREPEIDPNRVVQMLGASNIGKFIYKSDHPVDLPAFQFEVEVLEGWLSKEAYCAKIDETDFYVAPRFQEGIGFSFLEAMARGKIVLGHDDATMNEYIQDGVNGHLFDRSFRLRSPLRSPAQLQPALVRSCADGYTRWLKSAEEIQAFVMEG